MIRMNIKFGSRGLTTGRVPSINFPLFLMSYHYHANDGWKSTSVIEITLNSKRLTLFHEQVFQTKVKIKCLGAKLFCYTLESQ